MEKHDEIFNTGITLIKLLSRYIVSVSGIKDLCILHCFDHALIYPDILVKLV